MRPRLNGESFSLTQFSSLNAAELTGEQREILKQTVDRLTKIEGNTPQISANRFAGRLVLAAFALEAEDSNAEAIAKWALASGGKLKDPLEHVNAWYNEMTESIWTPSGRASLSSRFEELWDKLPEGTGAAGIEEADLEVNPDVDLIEKQ